MAVGWGGVSGVPRGGTLQGEVPAATLTPALSFQSTPGHPEVDCAKEEGSKPGPGASSAKEGGRRGGRQEAEEMEVKAP